MKLRVDIKTLSDKLENMVQNSLKNFHSRSCVHGKRLNPNEALRKEQPNTPTRQFVNTTVVCNEPVVAVRGNVLHNCMFRGVRN